MRTLTNISIEPIEKPRIFSFKRMTPKKKIAILVRLSCLVFLVVLFTIIWNL